MGSFSVNRSGLSMQDVQGVVTEGALMFGGAGLGGKVGQAAMGTAGRVLGTGIGTGAASLAQDQLARSHGSTEPIDLNRAVIAAGGGATGEWLLGVLGPKVWQTAKRVFGNGALYKPGAGLTDSGRAILRDEIGRAHV